MKKQTLVFLLTGVVISSALLCVLACDQIQNLFGKEDPTTPIKVTGSVLVPAEMPDSGEVWVGFCDFDPTLQITYPNPFPWANFSGSSQKIGTYTKGSPATYSYVFNEVPQGYYFVAALIDSNGNTRIDLAGNHYEYILEAIALYPSVPYSNGSPGSKLIKFNASQTLEQLITVNPFVTVTGTLHFDGTVTTSGKIYAGMCDLDISGYTEGSQWPATVSGAAYPNSMVEVEYYTAGESKDITFTLQKVPKWNSLWFAAIVDTNNDQKMNLQAGYPLEPLGYVPKDPNNPLESNPKQQAFNTDTNLGAITVYDPSAWQ